MRYVFIVMIIVWSMLIQAGAESIPQKISFQAKLFDAKTNQQVNDAKQLTFKIGDWVEIHENVKISNGIYSVILGSINPIPLTLFNNWQATIKVFADGKAMMPEIEIVSSPYAFWAESASKLGNTVFCKDGHLGIGTSKPGTNSLAINAPSLESTKDSINSFIHLYNRVGNGDFLKLFSKRISEGASWNTTCWRLQRRVDVTDMGYLQFGPSWGGAVVFGYAEKEHMRITNTGLIGMGTENPKAYLHVVNSKVNNTNVLKVDFSGGHVGSTNESAAIFRLTSNSGFRPLMSLNGKVVVTADGKLGIGTTKPEGIVTIASKNPNVIIKSNAEYGQDASLTIQGSRNGCGGTDTAMINFTNFDSDEGSNGTIYHLARISGYMSSPSGKAGMLKFYTNDGNGFNTPDMVITKNGNVGIGNSSPEGRLEVNGNITCMGIHQRSDESIIENSAPITNALEKVSQLSGSVVSIKAGIADEMNLYSPKMATLNAEDVKKAIPEAVHTNNDDVPNIEITSIIPYLVEAIKDLKRENEKLKQLLNVQ